MQWGQSKIWLLLASACDIKIQMWQSTLENRLCTGGWILTLYIFEKKSYRTVFAKNFKAISLYTAVIGPQMPFDWIPAVSLDKNYILIRYKNGRHHIRRIAMTVCFKQPNLVVGNSLAITKYKVLRSIII